MSRIKKIFTNWRVILLLLFLLLAVLAIRPAPFTEGVSIRSVAKDSAAMLAGIENPKPGAPPLAKERILSMNNVKIRSVEDYYAFVSKLEPNKTIHIITNKGSYRLTTKEKLNITELNETETITIEETIQENQTINGTTVLVNKTINKTIERPKQKIEVVGTADIGLRVSDAPKNNLRKGLDLQGGSRVLLAPAESIDSETLLTMVENLKERLNVYGLSDVVVVPVTDAPGFLAEGKKYILVEIAGATEEEIKNLVAKQGKFEAKIANQTVFKGGEDIKYVCKTAQCSGIDPRRGCWQTEGGWACSFMFSITLSPEAAQRQAEATKNLDVITKGGERYLAEPIVLYLDDQEVDKLNIADELKGNKVTEISISGTGFGATEQAALNDAIANMKRLQTVLITGSLPVKLDIVKSDTITPVLGTQFVKNVWLIGIIAFLAVTAIITIRYRKLIIALPIVLACASEVIMILGFAAFVGWNLDLAAIAGIIIAVGTGVDHLIIITDESLKKTTAYLNWKERFKRAFFIIFSAFFTLVVAMLPLLFAGAGLLKGFALTTIFGLLLGVMIARPAFGTAIRILLEEKQ